MQAETPSIRPLRAEHRPAWNGLWDAYLDFYAVALPRSVTDLTWRRILDPAEPIHGLAAIKDGQLAGFALYVFHPATWAESHYCYLEDLFVASAARRKNLGRLLIEGVRDKAKEAKAGRLY